MLLVEDIWDSIAAERGLLPLTPAQQQELDRRLAAHEANPEATISWEQVRQRIDDLRKQRGG